MHHELYFIFAVTVLNRVNSAISLEVAPGMLLLPYLLPNLFLNLLLKVLPIHFRRMNLAIHLHRCNVEIPRSQCTVCDG